METTRPGLVDRVSGILYTGRKHRWTLLLLSGATVPLVLYASNHGGPSAINTETGMYEFKAGTVIDPGEVNDNFSHLAMLVNTPDYVSAISVSGDGKVDDFKVGIGTTQKTYPLQVAGPNDVVIEAIGARAAGLMLSAGAEDVPFIRFKSGPEGSYEIGKVPNGSFYFNRNVADSDIGAQMVISEVGNVGIGTTSPSRELHVNDAFAGAELRISGNDGEYILFAGADLNEPWIGSLTNHDFRLITSNSEKMRVTTYGNVGIGTSNPLTALHLHERGIQIGVSSDPEENFHFASDEHEGDVDRALRLYNGNYGTGTQLASFAPDGKVGLRELNPDVHLDVLGGDELPPLKNAIVRLRASDVGGSDASLVLGVGSGNAPYISDGDSATSLGLFLITNGQNRVFINRAGNVGIGAADPKGTLDVNGSIYQRGNKLYADYVFQPDYQLESIEAHAEFMWREKHLAAVPAAQYDENGLEILEVGAHRMGMLEELEKAHVYIEQLNDRCKMLDEQVAKQQNALTVQQRELEDTKVRLARLEALLFSKK